MKIDIPTKPFLEALQAVAAIVPTRTPKDVLKSVKLSTANGITLDASDGEVSLQRQLDVPTPPRDAAVLLPPQRLLAILRETEAEEVSVDLSRGRLRIKAGRGRFELQAADAGDFPAFAALEAEAQTVDGAELALAISRTVFACDDTNTRFALSGVLFDKGCLVATDSRRLSVAPLDITPESRPIVPMKAAKILQSMSEGEVSLAFTNNTMQAESGGTLLQARLVEGRFPKWQDVVPRNADGEVSLVASPLLSAVRQSMIVTNADSRGVDWTFGRGELRLSSIGAEIGESDIVLPIADDLKHQFTLDPKFVVDWLKTLEAGALVEINFKDGASPVVFAAGEFQYVVMPLAKE